MSRKIRTPDAAPARGARAGRAARGGPRLAFAALGLLVVTLVAFAGTARLEFITVYDDRVYVTENPVVRGGLTAAGVRWAFTSLGHADNWHPLTWLSHMLDVELFGLAPRGHHLMNLALHALGAELLLVVLLALTGSLWPSAFVAALFAVHPLHVESVAWVAERKDVLSGVFWMATLGAYLRYLRRPGGGRYALVVAAFGLGLLAKPMLVTLPFVLLLLDFWPLGRLGGRRGGLDLPAVAAVAREKLPLLLLAAASSAMTILAQARAISPVLGLPPGARLSNAISAYAGYLGKTFWPSRLAIFYPFPEGIAVPRVAAAGLLLAALTVAAWWLRRTRPALAVGWLWYLGTLVPVIGLVQVGGQAMADRYTYLPLIGIFVAVAWGVTGLFPPWPQRRLLLAGCAVLAVGALLPVTTGAVRHWKSSLTIFRRALDVTSRNWAAESNYATALMLLGRTEEAMPHLLESARLSPAVAEAAYDLGVGYYRLGRMPEAVAAFRRAVLLDPTYAPAHYNLGVCAARSGDIAAAIGDFREALRHRPDHFDARFNLALLLERSGARREALEHFREAVRTRPDSREARAGEQRLLGTQ